jgi:predicted enzyme related to lactoylglutathione lyase
VGTVVLMALARFRALVIDAVDPELMARFWAPALGLTAEAVPSGFKLSGETPEHTVWLDRVPEAKTVKNRIHLDVHGAGVDDYPGATPLSAEGEFRWRVMADPEGGEFCVFVREQVPDYRVYEVVVDCADGEAQARWWHGVLGGRLEHSDKGEFWVEHVPGMPFECVVFDRVPEPKTVKNRVHWDVKVDDETAVDDLVAHGATVLRRPDDEISWTVLADPEGNEFCVLS